MLLCILFYPPVTGQRQTLTVGRSAHFSLQELLYFVFGLISTRFEASCDRMLLWASSHFVHRNILINVIFLILCGYANNIVQTVSQGDFASRILLTAV